MDSIKEEEGISPMKKLVTQKKRGNPIVSVLGILLVVYLAAWLIGENHNKTHTGKVQMKKSPREIIFKHVVGDKNRPRESTTQGTIVVLDYYQKDSLLHSNKNSLIELSAPDAAWEDWNKLVDNVSFIIRFDGEGEHQLEGRVLCTDPNAYYADTTYKKIDEPGCESEKLGWMLMIDKKR